MARVFSYMPGRHRESYRLILGIKTSDFDSVFRAFSEKCYLELLEWMNIYKWEEAETGYQVVAALNQQYRSQALKETQKRRPALLKRCRK